MRHWQHRLPRFTGVEPWTSKKVMQPISHSDKHFLFKIG
jgi:hypothetical protein